MFQERCLTFTASRIVWGGLSSLPLFCEKARVNRHVGAVLAPPCIGDVCRGRPPCLPSIPFVSICVHSWFPQERAGAGARPYGNRFMTKHFRQGFNTSQT